MLAKGARGGTRTRKPLRAMDFESIEFANFSTRARRERVAKCGHERKLGRSRSVARRGSVALLDGFVGPER